MNQTPNTESDTDMESYGAVMTIRAMIEVHEVTDE